MTQADGPRERFSNEDELLHAAAAQRLGEDPQVVVIRKSDEQLRKEAEEQGLTEARAQQ
jgi:hypothetical protein